MVPLKQSSFGRVVGYHGCDREIAERVLAGEMELRPSTNEYDWLGNGTYFWVDSPKRASSWARSLLEMGKIKEPYVVGAFIQTGLCLNLLDHGSIEEIRNAFDLLLDVLNSAGLPIPVNKGHKRGFAYERNLDAAVFNYVHDARKQSGLQAYDTVLGMFEEGDPVYQGTCFKDKTHLQIAVRDPKSIIGYFRVRDAD